MMMREIKFRGKDCWGNWRYGDLMKNSIPTASPVIVEDFYYDDPDDSMFEVNLDTVGQFTGLRDYKGNEIFEDDILQKRDELAWRTVDRGVVFWHSDECRWCVEMRDGLVFSLTSRKSNTWRVIGNVHDNLELLEAHV